MIFCPSEVVGAVLGYGGKIKVGSEQRRTKRKTRKESECLERSTVLTVTLAVQICYETVLNK